MVAAWPVDIIVLAFLVVAAVVVSVVALVVPISEVELVVLVDPAVVAEEVAVEVLHIQLYFSNTQLLDVPSNHK